MSKQNNIKQEEQRQTQLVKTMKYCVLCSATLLSAFVSAGVGGTGGSSEQLPGDRNSRTTRSTCGRKVWLTLGSTTWATILSTPCSSMPDLQDTDDCKYKKLTNCSLKNVMEVSSSLQDELSDVVPQLVFVQMRAPCVVGEVIGDKIVHSLLQVQVSWLQSIL